jgi:hypothetical protein
MSSTLLSQVHCDGPFPLKPLVLLVLVLLLLPLLQLAMI